MGVQTLSQVKGNFTPPSDQLLKLAPSVGSGYEREDDDWYIEPEWLIDALLSRVEFHGPIYDPCAGRGTIPLVCRARGLQADGSDIRDRGFGQAGIDFMCDQTPRFNLISNPPFGIMRAWIDHALEVTYGKVAVVSRLAFLEGQARKPWFESLPLRYVLVSSRRASMPPGNSDIKADGSKVAMCWLVFQRGWSGEPTLGWV